MPSSRCLAPPPLHLHPRGDVAPGRVSYGEGMTLAPLRTQATIMQVLPRTNAAGGFVAMLVAPTVYCLAYIDDAGPGGLLSTVQLLAMPALTLACLAAVLGALAGALAALPDVLGRERDASPTAVAYLAIAINTAVITAALAWPLDWLAGLLSASPPLLIGVTALLAAGLSWAALWTSRQRALRQERLDRSGADGPDR